MQTTGTPSKFTYECMPLPAHENMDTCTHAHTYHKHKPNKKEFNGDKLSRLGSECNLFAKKTSKDIIMMIMIMTMSQNAKHITDNTF